MLTPEAAGLENILEGGITNDINCDIQQEDNIEINHDIIEMENQNEQNLEINLTEERENEENIENMPLNYKATSIRSVRKGNS